MTTMTISEIRDYAYKPLDDAKHRLATLRAALAKAQAVAPDLTGLQAEADKLEAAAIVAEADLIAGNGTKLALAAAKKRADDARAKLSAAQVEAADALRQIKALEAAVAEQVAEVERLRGEGIEATLDQYRADHQPIIQQLFEGLKVVSEAFEADRRIKRAFYNTFGTEAAHSHLGLRWLVKLDPGSLNDWNSALSWLVREARKSGYNLR